MRKVIACLGILFLTSMMFTSCSSTKVNDVKVKVAEKVQVAVEKELNEAFDGVSISGVDCKAESSMIGEKVYSKLADFLKVKPAPVVGASLTASSTVSSLVPVLCGMVVEQVFPVLIRDDSGKYACLRNIGAVKLEKVGKDLCSAIDL